jgi:ferredoxin-NADP reductase
MATPRFARLTAATDLGPDTRLLDLALVGDEPLGFVGGQYVIVDSGLVLPSGKAAKRAYSILSTDADQARFQLAVKRIPGGLGSGFLHEAPVGTEIRFSGPWGKLLPGDGASGATLVLATDTGITAALGLLQSLRFAGLLPTTTLVWLRTRGDYFLPDELVRARLPAALLEVRIDALPPIDHPERIPWVRSLLGDLLRPGRLGQAFIAGDGAINYALLDDLAAAGVPATRDSVESFFNMPKKSAVS